MNLNVTIEQIYNTFVFFKNTVKPVYNDHPRDLEFFVAVVERWSLYRGRFML